MKITYFNISWISNEDGPGKRLVLFLQKCHLNCAWCHSPQSQGEYSPLLFFSNLCLKCGACVDACPLNVHKVENGVHTIERNHCIRCGECIKACPVSNEERGALMLPTKEIEVNALYQKLRPQLLLLKDIGGITISGGEPMLQVDAVKALLELCKQDGIHTAIETSGIHLIDDYRMISPLVDCWLVGCRLTTNGARINKNLFKVFSKSLAYLAKLPNSNVIARMPIVPNYTTFNEYYDKMLELLNVNNIRNVDLLQYNIHTSHYYNAIGQMLNDSDMLPLVNDKYEQAKTFFLTNKIKPYENGIKRNEH